MPRSKEEISQLVSSPSVGAIAYQAHLLVHVLNRISDEEFPREACVIREVLLCYAERGRDELFKLCDEYSKKILELKAEDATAKRIRLLGELIRELYSYIRYLLASSPRQSPPALQAALNQLVDVYFPKEAGTPICIVRPQWKYNLEYVPLTSKIRKVVALSVIDPDGKLGISSSEEILPPWWKMRREQRADEKLVGKQPPKQLAILSFAGLDTSDALCFPLLAHELGHFIDFSETPPYYLSKEIRESSQIRTEEVEDALKRVTKKNPRPEETAYETKRLVDQASICLRELLADLLATRMMGLSFFIAQAEFLKTLAPWSQPRILSYGHPAGYPGIKFRLWAILRHLLKLHPHSPEVFFVAQRKNENDAKSLIDYLKDWKTLLEPDKPEPPKSSDQEGKIVRLQTELSKITEKAVLNSLDGITKIAQEIIPDENCAKLTPLFFERILKLSMDLPPSCSNEDSKSFSEIMSAGWAYQILYGEERELRKEGDDKKYKEYEKTCGLVLKAIELIPAAQAIGLPPKDATLIKKTNREWLKASGVLSAEHIQKRVRLPINDDSHLAVLPVDFGAIKGASLDVHLGNWFSYARRTKLSSVKIEDAAEKELLATIGREEVFIQKGKDFLLHPGDLVLGVTQEFLGLPKDVMAFVEGKSGLGRLGLFVATATQVAPGYHGVIVLELANAGTVPLRLSPGMAIAQLVFQVMTESTSTYRGEYQCQIKP